MMKPKIGIIFAGDQELEPLLSVLVQPTIVKKAMLTFYCSTLYDLEVVTLYCGVCKTNAAIGTQILLDHFNCTTIINAGTAGGIQHDIQLFDTIVATESAYWDVAEDILTDFHPWMEDVYFKADEKLLALARNTVQHYSFLNVHFGRIITGESFITQQNRKEIEEHFAPLAVDMETASIAHTCYVNQIPFLAIRSITDTVDHQGIDEFDLNCDKASQLAVDLTLLLLQEISRQS